MGYRFTKHLLLRMPVGRFEGITTDFQRFITGPFFRAALYLASAQFYHQIARSDFNFEKLSDREKITLLKYINRFCFRPTPFGLFASVSLISWGGRNGFPQGPLDYLAFVSADQSFTMAAGERLLKRELGVKITFTGNPSLYRVLNEYRFFRTGTDDQYRKRDYLLQSTDYSRLLKDLVLFCKVPRSRLEIVAFIKINAACSDDEADDYFEFLVDAQLILNTLRPNITGQDYLRRLIGMFPANGSASWGKALSEGLTSVKKIEPEFFMRLNQNLKGLLPETSNSTNDAVNVILTLDAGECTIDQKYQLQLRDALFALDVLSPEEEHPAMAQFVKSFRQHFDGQRMPLLTALDPETGIGYQVPSREGPNPLLETMHIPDRAQTNNKINWTPAHAYLLDCWHRNKSGAHPVIRLDKASLEKIRGRTGDFKTLGLSVLFRLAGEQVFLESAGGNNAPALLGRFTLAGMEIREAAQLMARDQEAQNPEIIFAELLHLSDPHVDNVNRRSHIWAWELPVTASSILPENRQLALSDLFITIENNQVVLWSEAHQKAVIPRLTSAYNHSLNKLPLFRFLADIPSQFGRNSLSLDLKYYFPGLSFYPRVEYKEAILFLATWILREADLRLLQQEEPVEMITAFRQLSHRLALPTRFSLTEGDQQLVFNRDRTDEILFFAACTRQKSEIILTEYLGPEIGSDQPVRQFNTYLLPSLPLDFPNFPAEQITSRTSQRTFIPGSEWLYLKIYAPKIGASRWLLQLLPLIRKTYSHGRIKKWFFIRYEDHAPHIRLRLQIAPADISEVLILFKTRLESKIYQHVIREYQIDVYSRELERYRWGGAERSENFFWASSEFVVKFLKLQVSAGDLLTYQTALRTVRDMIGIFLPTPADQLQFTNSSYQQFLPEFENGPAKLEMDKKYRQLTREIQSALKDEAFYKNSGLGPVSGRFLRTVESLRRSTPVLDEPGMDFLKSLIHMHLNRLFTDEGRKQEMMVYFLLYKFLLSEKGRNQTKL